MRTALFVPATRLDRVAKAWAAGADAVIVDLEDAVAAAAKPAARQALAEYLTTADRPVWVRVNAGDTPWWEDDLAACASQPGLAGLVVPKAEPDDALRRACATGVPIMPLIETPVGLAQAQEVATFDGVQRLCFGILDFMAALGTRPGSAAAQDVLQQMRFHVLLASSLRGLAAPLDTVYPSISDESGLRAHADAGMSMGLGGMLCIHPSQICVVHAVYRPSADALQWAQRVLAHVQQTGEQAFQLDGQMVDLPVIRRAQRILSASED